MVLSDISKNVIVATKSTSQEKDSRTGPWADPARYVQVCVAGWSMGAIHACMVAAQCHKPVACVAMLPPDSAATAYCNGMLSTFTDLDALQRSFGCDASSTPLVDIVARSLNNPSFVFPNSPTRFAHFDNPSRSKTDSGGHFTAAQALRLFGSSQVGPSAAKYSVAELSTECGMPHACTGSEGDLRGKCNAASEASTTGTGFGSDWLPPLGQHVGAISYKLRMQSMSYMISCCL